MGKAHQPFPTTPTVHFSEIPSQLPNTREGSGRGVKRGGDRVLGTYFSRDLCPHQPVKVLSYS